MKVYANERHRKFYAYGSSAKRGQENRSSTSTSFGQRTIGNH